MEIGYSLILISVGLINVTTQRIFALECLIAMVTTIAEVAREVYTFNMLPEVVLVRVLLSTQGTLVASPSILKDGLLHVLIKHLSCIRTS